MNKKNVYILSFVVALSILTFYFFNSKPIAVIGDYKITDQDIRYREQIVSIYYPEYKADRRQAAIQQLINALQLAQILKNNQVPLTNDILQKESERIQKASLLPEKLKQIQDVFGQNKEAYFRDYILPVYAERVIYFEYFLHDSKLQAGAQSRAQKFLETSLNSKLDFDTIIQQNADFKEFKTAKIEVFEGEESFVKADELKKWNDEIVTQLKPGQVYSKVIDRNEYFLVVRLLKKSAKKSQFDAVYIPKANYQEWLEKEKSRVVIQK